MKDTDQRHEPALSSTAAAREPRERGGQLSDQLAGSPRQLAQRRLIGQTLGSAVQRVEGELGEEDESVAAAQRYTEPAQRQENRTGMPDGLKAGIESLSGMDMSDVRVHRNSSQPAQLNALAYAQGNDIHLGPGQEQHLPHEAWHVVQQRQGRVQATMQMAGMGVNDDEALEREADVMGREAGQLREKGDKGQSLPPSPTREAGRQPPVQCFKESFPAARTEENGAWPLAAPFQLATVQFDAHYDIEAYQTELKTYVEKCQQGQIVPVIDFRFYDAAFEEGVKAYESKARLHLEKVLKTKLFNITFSLLRDETMPAADQDPEFARSQVNKLRRVLQSLDDFKIIDDKESTTRFARSPDRELKVAALDKPIGKMLSGEMMVPAEEAFDFLKLSSEELESIFTGGGQVHYSLHQRLLARALMLNKSKQSPSQSSSASKQPSEKADQPPIEQGKQSVELPKDGPTRLRSNSAVKSNTLAMTNLVTGNEAETVESTLKACAAAFSKGTSQILLIVEDVPGKDGEPSRPNGQIGALKQAGYEVRVLEQGMEKLGRAQQSGVNLAEPGTKIPQRWKLEVRQLTREELIERFAHKWQYSVHPMSFYRWKLFRGYDDSTLDDAFRAEYQEYGQHLGNEVRADKQLLEAAKKEGFDIKEVTRALGF